MEDELGDLSPLERCVLLRALACAEVEGEWEQRPEEAALISQLVLKLGGSRTAGFIELPEDCPD